MVANQLQEYETDMQRYYTPLQNLGQCSRMHKCTGVLDLGLIPVETITGGGGDYDDGGAPMEIL